MLNMIPICEFLITVCCADIPADFDDSGLNVVLGAVLSSSRSAFGDAWGAWNDANPPLSTWSEIYANYSYQPFAPQGSFDGGAMRAGRWDQSRVMAPRP